MSEGVSVRGDDDDDDPRDERFSKPMCPKNERSLYQTQKNEETKAFTQF